MTQIAHQVSLIVKGLLSVIQNRLGIVSFPLLRNVRLSFGGCRRIA